MACVRVGLSTALSGLAIVSPTGCKHSIGYSPSMIQVSHYIYTSLYIYITLLLQIISSALRNYLANNLITDKINLVGLSLINLLIRLILSVYYPSNTSIRILMYQISHHVRKPPFPDTLAEGIYCLLKCTSSERQYPLPGHLVRVAFSHDVICSTSKCTCESQKSVSYYSLFYEENTHFLLSAAGSLTSFCILTLTMSPGVPTHPPHAPATPANNTFL